MRRIQIPENWPLPQDSVFRMLVFLRHAGCPFCRQALQDLKNQRDEIEANGVELVVIHMIDDPNEARAFLDKYDLADITAISDPEQNLYRHFGIRQGSANEYIGPQVWWKGLVCTVFEGHLPGKPQGDVSQLPGLILLRDDVVLREYRYKSSADRPDYAAFSRPLTEVEESDLSSFHQESQD